MALQDRKSEIFVKTKIGVYVGVGGSGLIILLREEHPNLGHLTPSYGLEHDQ
jgi:hypothetical protein